MIEFVHHALHLSFRNILETGVLWKVLSQQPVRILIGTPFPGRIGMSEVKRKLQGSRNLFVLGKLFSMVRGDGKGPVFMRQ